MQTAICSYVMCNCASIWYACVACLQPQLSKSSSYPNEGYKINRVTKIPLLQKKTVVHKTGTFRRGGKISPETGQRNIPRPFCQWRSDSPCPSVMVTLGRSSRLLASCPRFRRSPPSPPDPPDPPDPPNPPKCQWDILGEPVDAVWYFNSEHLSSTPSSLTRQNAGKMRLKWGCTMDSSCHGYCAMDN